MARVRLIVEYDLDQEHEATEEELRKELRDWKEGNVSVQDVLDVTGGDGWHTEVRIERA